jgi:UDP-N-acetylmuramoyl-tripeptide--D-alanyl-D-alanine ligase
VTGSAGKTTVKDMIAHLLGGEPRVLKSRGNFNNQYGLPLTLLKLDKRHGTAVVELGINHPGEMEWLTRTARPDVAVVTNIGFSHIGNFGSQGILAREKFKIARGLGKEGVLVLNIDDTRMVPREHLRNREVLTFGLNRGDVAAHDVEPGGFQTHFTAVSGHEAASTWVSLPGGHSVKNALAALSAVLALGGKVKPLAFRLRSFKPSAPMRMEVVRKRGILFVNDAYNASPTSVPAALEAFRQVETPGRKCAVLGDMLELGFFSNRGHEEALRAALKEDLDFWVFVGPRMKRAFQHAVPETWVRHVGTRRAFAVGTPEGAVMVLREFLQRGDAVLLKASRGLKLERIQEAL